MLAAHPAGPDRRRKSHGLLRCRWPRRLQGEPGRFVRFNQPAEDLSIFRIEAKHALCPARCGVLFHDEYSFAAGSAQVDMEVGPFVGGGQTRMLDVSGATAFGSIGCYLFQGSCFEDRQRSYAGVSGCRVLSCRPKEAGFLDRTRRKCESLEDSAGCYR